MWCSARLGRPVGRQEAPVEVDLAGDRLDQLDDQAAARAHRDADLPVDRLVALQERRPRGRHLRDVLDAEALAQRFHAAVEVARDIGDLPHVREQVAEGADLPRLAEQGHPSSFRPSRRAAFSFRISGRTSSSMSSCSKSSQPAVRGDHRVVRAEQHLPLQERVRVLDELGREVLRRPAGEVDVDLRLVHGDRDRLVLPRERRVREDDRHLGEVGRHVVHVDRVASTSAAGRRRPGRPSRSRCGRCGTAPAAAPPRSPRRAGRPSGRSGKNSWMFGWNLKPLTPWSAISRRARSAGVAAGGIDARERDHDVGVGRGRLGDLLVRRPGARPLRLS